MTTTFFPLILGPRSLSASDSIAPAGSSIIPSSLRNSRMVEHTLFSGQFITSILFSLQIEKLCSQTLATDAPSIKVSIVSSVVFFPCDNDAFMLLAHSGSTQIISVFFLRAFLAEIIPEITHPQPIGQIMISGLSSSP